MSSSSKRGGEVRLTFFACSSFSRFFSSSSSLAEMANSSSSSSISNLKDWQEVSSSLLINKTCSASKQTKWLPQVLVFLLMILTAFLVHVRHRECHPGWVICFEQWEQQSTNIDIWSRLSEEEDQPQQFVRITLQSGVTTEWMENWWKYYYYEGVRCDVFSTLTKTSSKHHKWF